MERKGNEIVCSPIGAYNWHSAHDNYTLECLFVV